MNTVQISRKLLTEAITRIQKYEKEHALLYPTENDFIPTDVGEVRTMFPLGIARDALEDAVTKLPANTKVEWI
jgi:secreted Zn-dependent insulinase-like peptidase